MEDNLFNPVKAEPKRSFSKLWISLLALTIVSVAGLSSYLINNAAPRNDVEPPTLQLAEGATLQGFIGSGIYLTFDKSDYQRFETYSAPTTRDYGVQLFYSDVDTTVKEMLENISTKGIHDIIADSDLDILAADDKLRVLFLDYSKNVDPEREFLYPNPDKDYDALGQPANIFYTYPAGMYLETKRIDDTDLDSYTIKANEGFFLVVDNYFDTWTMKGVAEAPSAEQIDLNTADKGWHMYATADFPALFNSCSNRVAKAFSSVGTGSDFEAIDLNAASPDLKDGAYMAWLYLAGDAGTCVAMDSGNGDCADADLRAMDYEICVKKIWMPCDTTGDKALDAFTCNTSGEWVRDTVTCVDEELSDDKSEICMKNEWLLCSVVEGVVKGKYVCNSKTRIWELVEEEPVQISVFIADVENIRNEALLAIIDIEGYISDITTILNTAESEMKDANLVVNIPIAYKEGDVVAKFVALNSSLSRYGKAALFDATDIKKDMKSIIDNTNRDPLYTIAKSNDSKTPDTPEGQARIISSNIIEHFTNADTNDLKLAKIELSKINVVLDNLKGNVPPTDPDLELETAKTALIAITIYKNEAKKHSEDSAMLLIQLRGVLGDIVDNDTSATWTMGDNMMFTAELAEDYEMTQVIYLDLSCASEGDLGSHPSDDEPETVCVKNRAEDYEWKTCPTDQDYISQSTGLSCINGLAEYCSINSIGITVNHGGTESICANSDWGAMWMVNGNTCALNNALTLNVNDSSRLCIGYGGAFTWLDCNDKIGALKNIDPFYCASTDTEYKWIKCEQGGYGPTYDNYTCFDSDWTLDMASTDCKSTTENYYKLKNDIIDKTTICRLDILEGDYEWISFVDGFSNELMGKHFGAIYNPDGLLKNTYSDVRYLQNWNENTKNWSGKDDSKYKDEKQQWHICSDDNIGEYIRYFRDKKKDEWDKFLCVKGATGSGASIEGKYQWIDLTRDKYTNVYLGETYGVIYDDDSSYSFLKLNPSIDVGLTYNGKTFPDDTWIAMNAKSTFNYCQDHNPLYNSTYNALYTQLKYDETKPDEVFICEGGKWIDGNYNKSTLLRYAHYIFPTRDDTVRTVEDGDISYYEYSNDANFYKSDSNLSTLDYWDQIRYWHECTPENEDMKYPSGNRVYTCDGTSWK